MKSISEAIRLVIVACVCGGLALWLHPKAPDLVLGEYEKLWGEISDPEEVLWVDARTDEEYEEMHLDGALLLNLDDESLWFERQEALFEVWNPEADIVVYCSSHSCLRSHEVAKRLREDLAVENVFVLQGGWESLIEAGLVKEDEK